MQALHISLFSDRSTRSIVAIRRSGKSASYGRGASKSSYGKLLRAVQETLESRRLLSTYTLSALASFDGTGNGAQPTGGVIMDPSGNLFGTAFSGGATNFGTVFEFNKSTGVLAPLASFDGTDGSSPQSTLLLDGSGNLFGTTQFGGPGASGVLFEVGAGQNSISPLADFSGAVGAEPLGGVVEDAAGDLFGTTSVQGPSTGGGVYEEVQGSGVITPLANADVSTAEPVSNLLMDAAGNLYGTAQMGGAGSLGSVFELPKGGGALVPLATFMTPAQGEFPTGLVMDAAGNLYGSAEQGGANGDGIIFEVVKGSGVITTLGTFNGTNGMSPTCTPIVDAAGDVFGTAALGGANSFGTAFEIVKGSGVVTTLASFDATTGTDPNGALSMDAAGNIYGATDQGGANETGTIFELSPGPAGPATQLSFATTPVTATAGVGFSSAVVVDVEDASGMLVSGDNSTVTLGINTGSTGGTLGGTISATAVNGMATFANVSISAAGGYTLSATDGTLMPATSSAITVSAALPPATVGGLDPAFGTGGLASHDVGFTSTAGLVVQGDGKSVIAGTSGSAGSQTFGITRYNADGSLDTTFGTNGVTDTPLPGSVQTTAEILLGNGDILIAGTDTTMVNGQPAGSQFALVEYTSAGLLDPTFGNGAGYVLTSFSATPGTLSTDVAHALAIGSDGTIYLAGSSDANGHGQDFAIAAYTAAGAPSPTFATNGKVLLDFTGGNDSIAALALGAKGALIAAGLTTDPTSGASAVALAEFLPSGALNPKFGVKGKITTSVGGVDDAASALAIDSKGKIVVGGYTATGSASAGTLSSNFLLLRYTSAGKLDKTFGAGGVVTTSFNHPTAVSSVILSAGGTIVASGKSVASLTSFDPSMLDLALARYTVNGQLDTSFNKTGTLLINLSISVATDSLSRPLAPFDATSDLMAAFMQLTQSDQGVIAVTAGGELLDVGNSGANTVEAAIVAEGLDLAASFISSLPASIIGGGKGTATVNIAEAGTELASGAFTIELFASTTPSVPAGETPFQTVPAKLKLKEGGAENVKLKFKYPTSLATGSYYLIASIDTGALRDLNAGNNSSASASTVLIAPPFVQLNGSGLTAPTFDGAKPASVSFTITNVGNETASASAVQFFASTTATPTGGISLATTPLKLNLKAGAGHLYKFKLALPTTLPAGTYMLVALLDPANVFNDPNSAMNFIVSGNTFVAA